ncbi:hypothetical protein ABRZ04_10435 [Castellaniella ginsengisoli]|uniref:DUF2570 domain-containing protein n=1 Tax=Castellaniella ginsengisoli TaxID=546114 RepID=A0AB39CWU1_9BURK
MIAAALKALAGWKGYAAAALAGALVAGGAAWTVQGWRYGAQIAGMERDQARDDAQATHLTLGRLQTDIDSLAAAGRRAAAVGPTLTAQINKLTGALKDAPPLPDGCRPDPVRMRSLTDSVRATNRAAAGQPTGAAVPADP